MAVDQSVTLALASHVWLNGRIVPAGEPHLLVTDRGFQLGDGIFETLRARRGVPIEMAEHLARLRESAAALRLALLPDDALTRGLHDLLVIEGLADPGRHGKAPGDAAVRITVSRGPLDSRGLTPAGLEEAAATSLIQAWRFQPPSAVLLDRGVAAMTSSIRRDATSPLASVKSTSRADHVFAKLEAQAAGMDDAIFLTPSGGLCEATSANVVVYMHHRLATPPLTAGILAGTTRGWLITEGPRLGRAVDERDLRMEHLLAADEAFLCSSVAGIVPLISLDGRPIGDGVPGPVTLSLRLARERWIDETSLELSAPPPKAPRSRRR